MTPDVLVGIDIGSSNVKTVLFDGMFQVLTSRTQEYETLIPQPGWSEYRPDQWWECVCSTLRGAIDEANIEPERIAGVGLSSLGCCPIPMDKKGNVVCNGIPWSDQRAQAEVDFLVENCRESIFEKCKNYPTTLNATTHLMWIKNNLPEIYWQVHKYTEPTGFLGQRFTGEYTMDYAFASALDFGFDTRSLEWDDELIEAMGLDREIFPRLHPNAEPLGCVTAKAAGETGVPEGVPVYCGSVDMLAATLAAGAIHPGQGFYSMGSGSNMMVITDNQQVAAPELLSLFHPIGPHLRLLDGVQGSIGYSMRWFRDQFGGSFFDTQSEEKPFERLSNAVAQTAPGAGGLIYLPHLFGKFHPTLNPSAKGVFFGFDATTSSSQFVRAVMEGCTFAANQSLMNIRKLGLSVDEIIVTGGPSNSPQWCQIMADIFGCTIVTVRVPDASPFGSAILTGVGTGVIPNFDAAIPKGKRVGNIYQPNRDNAAIYEDLFELYQNTYTSLLDPFEELAAIDRKHELKK